ncbi:hypothetical protein BGW36DRAFT_466147 [Talaromyces proteolyticus]|uniref:Zn(2)-C6 fungal-type domain-containing protein n=1 Tax=Talaromyces proteolyticus TaxID=1131652 RepID=A0AAD4PS22_9EURO|nr:uncharacterized protein BGW36DRAFT_466147 [Talaromyces proteolyticus]KAH8690250.1 hypothetical protein BGW36DRAFT_466147 [Talaromyces proteolyticus]
MDIQGSFNTMASESNTAGAMRQTSEVSLQACKACSQQKKRCDRALPVCGSCVKKVRKCYYPVPEVQSDEALVNSLYRRIDQLESAICRKSTLPRPPDYGAKYPIPKQWYFSTLLSYRDAVLRPLVQQYPNSIATMLQTTWMQAAWSDPCLFHATLYSTSAHMDITHDTPENPVTTYHKTETLRLIREAIANSDHSSLPTSVVAATLHLLYFAKLKGEFNEGTSHESGIEALLRYKGMGEPQPDNIIGYFLIIQQVWNALVLRVKTVFPVPRVGSNHRIGNYSSLLSNAAERQMERPPRLRLPESALELVREFAKYSTMSVIDSTSTWSNFIASPAYQQCSTTADSKQSQVEKCCVLAGIIYLRALLNVGSSTDLNSDPETQKYVLSLKDEITNCDESFWYRCGPEVFRWVLMTGAAAGSSLSQRAWFIARMCPFCAVMVPQEVDDFLAGADHLVWLFNHKYPR